MYSDFALLALFVFGYNLVAARVEKMALSGPIVFMTFGLIVGPTGLGVLNFAIHREMLELLAEVTLAVVLFADAASTDFSVLKRVRAIPMRLLLIGLPLTMALGFLVGWALFPNLSLFEVALLATMLAPTDAALGSAVVSNPVVPAPLRQALNVESGLNDGICVPFIFVFLAMALDHHTTGLGLRLVAGQLGIGIAVGAALTFAGIALLRWAAARGLFSVKAGWGTLLALALSCFALSQLLGGSGFIAAFVGGLVFAAKGANIEARHAMLETSEGVGKILSLITWVVFGAAVVGKAAAAVTWDTFLYAVLSLTVIRMVPVALSLIGSGVDNAGKAFVGWFGPRGLASIVFIIIVLEELEPEDPTLTVVVAVTVILSVLAHGITANPLAARIGARASS